MVMLQEEWRNVNVMPLMGYFQITSMIYRIANNLICQASNVVLISHLKQFIGCSLTIIQEGHACFMNNKSNSETSRLDNEKLLRGMRPIQVQRPSTNTLQSSCRSPFLKNMKYTLTFVHFLHTSQPYLSSCWRRQVSQSNPPQFTEQ